MRTKRIDMLEGPVFKNLVLYSLPIVFSGILQILFNAADLAVVGRFAGTAATAAVGATGSFISLIVNTVMGLSSGVNVTLARAIGARDHKKTSDIVHTAMTVSLVAGITVGIVGASLSSFAMDITKCPEESFDKAVMYLLIYFAGCPAIFVYNFGAAILRTKGDTKRPLFFLIIAGITNVLLNILFVLAFGMDADGVALATTISQYIAAFLTVKCLSVQEDATRLFINKLRVIKEEFLGIVKYGLPSGLTNAMYSFANIQIQSAINKFGASAVAGNSAGSSLEGFIASTYAAMNAASVAFVGQNIGAQNKARIKKIIFVCLGVSVAASVILGWGMFLIGDPLFKIYVPKDINAIEIAGIKASIMFTTYFILAASQNLGAVSQAFGYSMHITIISILGIFGLRTIWMNTIVKAFPTRIEAVFWCYPASWVLILIANGVVLAVAYNRYMKKGSIK
ncbi:MAG: MATE family efflux transporter [Clostridia bacterium]|nr:MATE family efflux transporter [Clostridia bacterium]